MLSKLFTNKNRHPAVLSASNVVSIIQACKGLNVKHLSFNGLTIHLGEVEGKETPLFQQVPETPLSSQEVEDQKSDILKELHEQQLLLTDPNLYERTRLGITE